MAVVNQYKFYGKATTAAETVSMLSPAVNETFIIKSLRVTNKSGSNTPTISITNNAFFIINTQQLATSTSVEILTLPLIVEGGTQTLQTFIDANNIWYEILVHDDKPFEFFSLTFL